MSLGKQTEIYFSSESVSSGHPDKVCDQISDAILDMFLAQDPKARVACETVAKDNSIVLAGELTSTARITDAEMKDRVREVINNIGYDNDALGFNGNTCTIINMLGHQSPDIAQGVDREVDLDQGAGDQGIMFGYACSETEELMPAALKISHDLLRRLEDYRKGKGTDARIWEHIRPDSKSQVTLKYVDGKATEVDTVLISTQHSPSILEKNELLKNASQIPYTELVDELVKEIIEPVLESHGYKLPEKILINPTGKFVIGGPVGDAGLTGRKIIVDTYGGAARHGGGAFSGKDPSKVDRSAAYMGRYVAKNVVAAGLAEACEIQVSYAIGVAEPTSIHVETFGTVAEGLTNEDITKAVIATFDFRPAMITKQLELVNPSWKYQDTAAYGHFGREDLEVSWERTDKADELRKFLNQ